MIIAKWGTAMTDFALTAARRGLLTIDRTMSRIVLMLWLSALERQLGSCGEVEGLAD
jgi:hypothetical protein